MLCCQNWCYSLTLAKLTGRKCTNNLYRAGVLFKLYRHFGSCCITGYCTCRLLWSHQLGWKDKIFVNTSAKGYGTSKRQASAFLIHRQISLPVSCKSRLNQDNFRLEI